MTNDERATTELRELYVSALVESPTNPRRMHDAKAHADLVASVREIGIITPLLVRPNGGAGKFRGSKKPYSHTGHRWI